MRLLLVEDDAELSASLRRGLSDAGFAVDVEGDGEAAEFLGATESYDLVVLDLGLPKLSGLAVLKCWRAAGHTMPVLVLDRARCLA